jgi:PBP1b-binding outer membrane lipoprotein LpoB
VFVEELQRALINSGRVQFVASASERGDLRAERADQDLNASEETRKEHGQEIGADYGLSGTISSVQDREGGESVLFYQVNLKLVDVKTNQIVWHGQKKIKKSISRASATF